MRQPARRVGFLRRGLCGTALFLAWLVSGSAGWDISTGYAFEKGLLLEYTLSLETQFRYSPDRQELYVPVRSRYTLRFWVLDKNQSGEAVLAAATALDDVSLPEEKPGADRIYKEVLKSLRDWIPTFKKTDSAAVVLDPHGNILRGRMPWPEGTCFQLPLVLAGLSIRKRGWDWNVGGRYRIENSYRGLDPASGGDKAVFTSGNNLIQARLLVDTGRALPFRYEAKYGYQTFRSVYFQTLTMELVRAQPGYDPAAFGDDPAMLAAVIQAATLAGPDALPRELLSRALGSPLPELRLAAAAHLAVRGIPEGIDPAPGLKDKDERIRFNAAKALFRRRGDRTALEAFLEDGTAELRVRAARLLEVRPLSAIDAGLIQDLGKGVIPAGFPETEVYDAVRALLREGRERPIAQIGPADYGLASGLDGRRIYHVAVHCPADYDPAEAWPVIINLTGGNGFAESAFLALKDLVPAHYILVSPDAAYGNWWDADQVRMFDDLLKWIVRNYAADPDRVYLTGFSNGGIGAYRFASLHPDRFTAVAALEGYSKPPGEERGVETEMMLNLKNTPVFIIHGDRDPVIPIEPDRILADFLQRNAIPFRFLAAEGVGHTINFESHKDDLLSFFRKYRRDPAPAKLNLVLDESAESRNYWIRIERKADPARRASVKAEIKKGKIAVETKNVAGLSLLLNDLHYGPDPLEIVIDKKVVFQGRLRLDPAALGESLRTETDYARLYGVKLTFDIQAP